MTRKTAGTSILIGTAAGAVLMPAAAAACAVAALKSGSSAETVTACAALCAFASAFASAFIASKLSGNPLIGAASSGIILLALLVFALIAGESEGIFTVPLASLAGGIAAFFLSGVKRKKSAKPKIKAKKPLKR